jgi:hypothetical protein
MEIQGDYRKKCKDIDRDYHGTRADEIGPLQHHLESHGKIMELVVGQYGETSQGVHDLMDAIATSRADYISRAEGRPLSKNERSGILAAYRRRLSVIGVRSQSKCLLERMGHIGQGASAAAERRQKALRTEAAARKERQSHYEAYIRGKKLSIGSSHASIGSSWLYPILSIGSSLLLGQLSSRLDIVLSIKSGRLDVIL